MDVLDDEDTIFSMEVPRGGKVQDTGGQVRQNVHLRTIGVPQNCETRYPLAYDI